jgi:hypothetical protein
LLQLNYELSDSKLLSRIDRLELAKVGGPPGLDAGLDDRGQAERRQQRVERGHRESRQQPLHRAAEQEE